MLNNYLTVINSIDTFCANHANIHRFKSSFFEQIDDFSTSGNSFPIFYAVPNDIAMEENIDVMSFRIYCLDILQKDRVNEEAILNSTYQNLRDLVNWFRNDEFNDLNVLNSPRAIPVNNFLVDFTTGWYIDVELEVSVVTNDCSIPFTQNFQLTGTSCDVSYITPYLTCATVTGCTTLQAYVANQINSALTGGTGGGFSGWTASTGISSIVANNGFNSTAGNFAIAGGTNNLASGDRSFIGNGSLNSATTQSSSILGGSNNLANGQASAIIGGAYNVASGSYSNAGGYKNTAAGSYSSVLGGNQNTVQSNNSFIGSGQDNLITGNVSAIVTGLNNRATGTYNFIGGGARNSASTQYATVVGGATNNVNGAYSFIGAGIQNSVIGGYSLIVGGKDNKVNDNYSSIVGGQSNSAVKSFASVLGGYNNLASGYNSSVLGGGNNRATQLNSATVGGYNNIVSGQYSVIIGGKNITATQDETAYVPFLNIQSASTDNALVNVLVRDSSGEIKTRTVSSIAPVFSGTTDFYAKFTSGGSLSNGMISDNGVLSNLRLASSGDNINVSIISPSGFYYPTLSFYNNGATSVGSITGYAGRLYVSPLSVGGTIDMGANKIVNMSPGTNQDDAINLSQLFSNLGNYLNLSGGTVTGYTTFNNGLSADTLTVSNQSNLYGNIFTSFSGSTNRVVEAGTTGALSATKDLIDSFLSAGTAATLLTTASNWNVSKQYTGTTLTGTYQGQQYYDSNYYFVCVDDNDWIRIPRI